MFTVSSDSIPRNVTFKIYVVADQGYIKDFDIAISILPNLLFVDDDDGNVNVNQYYTNTFNNLGIAYDIWDRSVQGPLTASQLVAYKTVVWGCEWAFPSLDSLDRTAIGGYLDNRGQLFISGQDIGWDLCDPDGEEFIISSGTSKPWYETYFKIQYQADNAKTTTLNGVSGDPIGDGLVLSFTEPLRNTLIEQYPDIVLPISGSQSVFQYPAGGIGATRYDSTYKLVYFGFGGFEAITSETMRDTVMDRTFSWLNGYKILHTPLNDTESQDSQRVEVQVVSTSNIESINLYWDTDGAFPFNKRSMQAIGGGFYETYIPGQTSAIVQYTIIVRTANGYIPNKLYSYKAGDITGVEEKSAGEGPKNFALHQNYPNPFNPTTVISYQLPDRGTRYIVSLKVHDMLGREVATLVSETSNAGYYAVTFDGSKFSSGIYFYRLRAGNFVSTHKMLLLK